MPTQYTRVSDFSENADFAEMVEEHGFAFVGPSPDHIRSMGDKIEAKRLAIELGLPVVPGSDGAITFRRRSPSDR